ncbi:hypothetical protein COX93_00255 [Candidatus Nomurabacteria bacterium CG_4_10_14_0_2_um_filter_30_12]|uniref:HEPN domain-containing protein n=2 Tax=Candidatus Nomuraibacteriota TaxID=1752729 RepID=A0A1J4UVU9_9BACT|nr:MAG: hypothetical protein AUJ22_02115 [Candidatus Nomurabacteria bacterium CG1_02_31_12]PIZ87715.1 MAG: hypothetical protein COX93_00255 [Candidatus Nomurabacteria bacterium CG_4_10_14_0_2_um_filter_30_12]
MKKSNKDKHYNWLMGADMYLAASIILCKEMLIFYKSPNSIFNSDQRIDKKCGFTSNNPDYEMLLPVIFNLKHGIELYLKALTMQTDINLVYSQSHDLIALLNILILKIKDNHISNSMLKILDYDIRKIVEKYYFGLYAFAQERVYPDINNEAERYPEYKNPNCYKIENLCNINMNVLLNEIINDCVFVQKLLREDILKKLKII